MPVDKETKAKQQLAVRLANQVVDRHINLLAGSPLARKEAFRKDLKRDVVQAACEVAGIPVPASQV